MLWTWEIRKYNPLIINILYNAHFITESVLILKLGQCCWLLSCPSITPILLFHTDCVYVMLILIPSNQGTFCLMCIKRLEVSKDLVRLKYSEPLQGYNKSNKKKDTQNIQWSKKGSQIIPTGRKYPSLASPYTGCIQDSDSCTKHIKPKPRRVTPADWSDEMHGWTWWVSGRAGSLWIWIPGLSSVCGRRLRGMDDSCNCVAALTTLRHKKTCYTLIQIN